MTGMFTQKKMERDKYIGDINRIINPKRIKMINIVKELCELDTLLVTHNIPSYPAANFDSIEIRIATFCHEPITDKLKNTISTACKDQMDNIRMEIKKPIEFTFGFHEIFTIEDVVDKAKHMFQKNFDMELNKYNIVALQRYGLKLSELAAYELRDEGKLPSYTLIHKEHFGNPEIGGRRYEAR